MREQDGLPGIGISQPQVVSQRKFGDLVGVSGQAIGKAIESGRLSADCVCETKSGKQLYLEKALMEWESTHSDRPLLDEDADELELAAEEAAKGKWGPFKTQQEALLAEVRRKLLDLQRAELEGVLHRAEDVEMVWAEAVSDCRLKLLGLPGRISGKLSLRLKKDRVLVQEVLEKEIELALAELAGDVRANVGEQREKRIAKKR